MNRGYAYNGTADYQLALKDFDRAIALGFDNAIAFNGRGFSKLKLGQIDAAITDYNLAIQRRERYASAFYGRGLAEKLKGDRSSSEADIASAQEIDAKVADKFQHGGL